MANRDFLPSTETGLITWQENFVAKLATHAATLGATPAQIAQFTTDQTDTRNSLNSVQAARTTLQSLVKQKDALLEGVNKRVRDAAVVFKRHPAYTQAIGEDLGIVPSTDGRAPSIRLAETKPTFQSTMLPDKVRLDWVKGDSDGVVVQCKRGAEANFTTLDKDTKSPYDDARRNLTADQPETRIYRMRYLSADTEVGSWSDEVRVVCMI